MDVSLILTHRCNLDCGYCYAGEHHGDQIDDETLDQAVDLLFADDVNPVQLSFFGGEPFLAFESMKRACERAERQAAKLGRKLILQCTTNGYGLREEHIQFIADHSIHVTVSIDGVREAQELNRPRANGHSSFDRVKNNLRKLVAAGAEPDAMMVISPATARHTYRSAGFLWGKGVRVVRANMQLDAHWSEEDRQILQEELLALSSELVARRLRGERVSFEPFEKGMRAARGAGASEGLEHDGDERAQVVVATTGNLYPCAPMVGPDRDAGPEAALRIGHLAQGPSQIMDRVRCEGTQCHKGGGCQCAAYLETGDRHRGGPNGRWYSTTCIELGRAVAAALAGQSRGRRSGARRSTRPLLIGVAATIAAAAALPMLYSFVSSGSGYGLRTMGDMPVSVELPAAPEPRSAPELDEPCELPEIGDSPPVPGGLRAPEPIALGDIGPPPEPIEPEVIVDGEMAIEVEPEAPVPEVHVKGGLSRPPDDR